MDAVWNVLVVAWKFILLLLQTGQKTLLALTNILFAACSSVVGRLTQLRYEDFLDLKASDGAVQVASKFALVLGVFVAFLYGVWCVAWTLSLSKVPLFREIMGVPKLVENNGKGAGKRPAGSITTARLRGHMPPVLRRPGPPGGGAAKTGGVPQGGGGAGMRRR